MALAADGNADARAALRYTVAAFSAGNLAP